MSKPTIKAPVPWVEAANASDEAPLGELFRSVKPAQPLPVAALAQVREQLRMAPRSSLFQRRLREAVLACVMLLAGSSLALAGWGVSEWWSAHRASPLGGVTAASAGAPSAHALAPRGPIAHSSTPSLSAAAPESVAPAAQPTAPAARAATSKGADQRVDNAADASALAAESLALQNVLTKLRREHDARGALALLDQSQALFEHGALALEAQVARVDALLLLGRPNDALAILNRLPLGHMGRGGELRVQRAELRARTDCGLALADFDALTRQTLPPALAERALYGRAACELRVGDDSHAQSDLHDYLTRFPTGRFAADARQQLARTPQNTH